MYKITRVEELYRGFNLATRKIDSLYSLDKAINDYIKHNLKKDEFLVHVEYFKNNEDYDEKIIEELEKRNIDLIVLAGYLNILSKKLVSKYSKQIINIHPSLIPSFCGDGFYGENVHKAVINSGVKFTGATTHFVDENVDTGSIIMQDVVSVNINDDYETIAKKVLKIEHIILVNTIKAFCENRIIFDKNRAFIVEE